MRTYWHPDEDGEAFVLENGWDVAIPVNFEERKNALHISFFPSAEAEIRAWFAGFSQDPFTTDALAALFRALEPKVREWGYVAERHRERWGYILHLSEDRLQKEKIREDSRMLTAEDEDRNATTYDLEATVEDGRLAAGSVIGGRVVSVAVTHAAPRRGKTAEIGVETVPAHRGKGLAVSNLALLSRRILDSGAVPEYRCYADNEASLCTAMSAGFEITGRYYYYVLRRRAR